MTLNLLITIRELMNSDDDNLDRQDSRLRRYYRESENKDELNKIFIALCGYSLDTMINRPKEVEL